MQIQACSIGAPLTQVLRDSRVIAQYDSTLALETRNGTLWAITTRLNPAAMRVVVPILPAWRDGATVYARDGKIFADGIELTSDANARFDPVPRKHALSTTQRASAARTIAGALARHQLPDALGFWDELSEMWEPLCRVIARACPELVEGSTLSGAQRSRRGDEAISEKMTNDGRQTMEANVRLSSSVLRLIGRGSGLTPTGDDFLQALLVTLASGDDADRAAFEALKCAVTPHLSRTTRVSRAFLQEAMKGWAFGALKDVLDELPMVTQDKVDALLGVGATSGPAYAFGMLMGLSWKEECAE